jgi:ABC-type uncharacterized transport system permease subunit
MTPDGALNYAALLCYVISTVCYHLHVFGGSDRARRIAVVAVVLGLLAHTAAIGVYCSLGRGSVLRGTMPYSLVAYFIALGQAAAALRKEWSSLGALTMPLAFITQFVGISGPVMGGGHPASGSTLLRPHVTVLLLGFAAFTLSFCLAVIYLLETRLLKEKKIRGLFSRLPPVEAVAAGAHWMAIVGFSLLTLGVITGAIAAPTSWGPDWYTNPRVLPSVITSLVAWAIYAAYLGVSMLGWRGRRTTYFLIAGFVVVLIAFFASVSQGKSAARTSAAVPERSEPGPSGPGSQHWVV